MYSSLKQIKIHYFFLSFLASFFIEANEVKDFFKIGFGSCLDQDKPQEIWKSIREENLNDFFFMGDNVYGDTDTGKLVEMKQAYLKQEQRLPVWLKNLTPLAIWDDHDYGINDGGNEYYLKKESQKLFLEFLHSL